VTPEPAFPRWSVVIPTRDRFETLSACLARLAPGVQSLDAASYEVIVTDDGRSGRTHAELAGLFPWARWVEGPARGPAANRNNGAATARGQWIVFTDDDTLPEAGWLAAYEAAANASPAVDVLEGRTTCLAGFGTPMHYAPVNETGGRLWSCNLAVRADRFRAIHGFDEGFTVAHMEDQDLRERLRNSGAQVAWVPAAVVDHPPRRQPSGYRLGLQRVAEVRYLCKHGAPVPLRWRLLRRIARLRIGIIRSLPFGTDSVRALLSLASELLTVQWRFSAWERRARREFPAAAPQSVAQVRNARHSPVAPR
jgi:GT2 family glycosyltransferase